MIFFFFLLMIGLVFSYWWTDNSQSSFSTTYSITRNFFSLILYFGNIGMKISTTAMFLPCYN
ncbi:hypothetical protein BD560DRAFT_403136 [Blakeslea trispora]|nr:hypothetical protein BD560DRAFT_403136 [Blakeslea trispora]